MRHLRQQDPLTSVIDMRTRTPRNGTLSLELLLVLPILLSVLGGTIMFGMILVAEQTVTAASQAGARAAAQGGGDCVAGTKAAEQNLGGNLKAKATVTCNVDNVNHTVTVTVSVPATDVIPDLLRGFGFSICNIIIAAKTTMPIE
jgi:Flp pilus assembly protein TadG